jgi:hypothetical protein
VIERDGGCSYQWVRPHVCAGRIDPHHVWMKGQGGPDVDWNLTAVCRWAHDEIHNHPKQSERLGWLSWSWNGEMGARQALDRRQTLSDAL